MCCDFPTAPLTNNPSSVKVKERISFRHQYNSRTDPNEPVRGKVNHWALLWHGTAQPSCHPLSALPVTSAHHLAVRTRDQPGGEGLAARLDIAL